ncbi:unnamed protein product, partial [Polarella glacialis]
VGNLRPQGVRSPSRSAATPRQPPGKGLTAGSNVAQAVRRRFAPAAAGSKAPPLSNKTEAAPKAKPTFGARPVVHQ